MTTRLGVKTILTFGAGWIANSAYQVIHSKQSQTSGSIVIDGRIVKNRPALPIFGVVSAATPYDTNTGSDVATRVSQIMQHGFPSLDNIRSFDDYVLSYDRRNKVANWVFEHLTPDGVKHNEAVDRSKCDFKEDLSIHPYFRSTNEDYKYSGYDRGHLAAAGNHKAHQKHCEQTFLLSNMAPQVGRGFNRDSWNRLERHVRKLTKTYQNVYVCTGPMYLAQKESDGKSYVKYEVIGKNMVSVPTHFFKVVVAEDSNRNFIMESYVMPNAVISDDTPLTNFMVKPETIEKLSGLLFFDRVARDKLKSINGKKA
ncbi:endonuclease G, mitochondrial-like [Thrips palmi]|uniref:Endonuclease n=1 Tax=Thrips palmi TaxID=161013 RepID=A0A6P8Y2N4_THRPL|nr:endonuclease G, mitochondrial-like [Thrips palmi]